jgi:tetratricopeptide (TPR) repeat protein
MAKSVHFTAIIRIFSIFLLFTAITPVFGGGRQDPDLTKADNLINNKKYSEALAVLSDYAKRNPDKFDLAQQRIRKIYQLQNEFNRTADELVTTILDEPQNSKKILELTNKLNSLEKEKTPLLENFVSRTQEIAQFNAERNRLADILERGRKSLDVGDCMSAIQIYAEGMDFMRDEFFSADYGAIIENGTRRESERINSILASFQQTSSQMGTFSAELVRAINLGNTAAINETMSRLTPAMDRFIALKQELYTADTVFIGILNVIRAREPDIVDRNHISFMRIVINGRNEESIQEGMLGAFDTYWKNSIEPVVVAITQNLQKMNSASLAAFNSKDYATTVSSLGRNTDFANFAPLFFNRHRQLLAGSAPQTVALYGNNILRADIPPYLEIRALSEANNVLLQTANAGMRLNIDRSSLSRWREGTINTAQALNSEQQTRNTVTGMQNTINSIITNATQINTDLNSYHKVTHITNALTAVNTFSYQLITEELQSAQRYYSIAYNSLQNSTMPRRESLEKSRKFLDGESRTSNGVVTVFRYPTEALTELTALLSALNADLQNGNNVLTQFRNDPQTVSTDQEITSTREKYQETINELTNIRAQALSIAETARTKSTQAEAFRQEGERLFREAQTAFQRQNYDTARDRIQRASDKFSESLEVQESASLRQMRDTQLVNLGQQIAISENQAIITEVRNMLNNASALYFNGNFQQAEDVLTRARNRWRTTSPEDNEEIIYWLGIVRTAMSARSERVIPQTAPLYAEMSQLLSQAQRNFDEGTRYINSGQRTLGIAKFDEARQLTRQVRLIFPVNQEAGILELKIEQFLDPATFNSSFEQRLRTAVAGTKQRSVQAFADLQNLAEINPRYQNIRAIVTQAEIDMGYRPQPPNPANIARARELTTSARRILENNTTAQYEVALAQLNQAISLNPNNTEAPQIRDRLLSRMSVPGSIVLSSEDEADYQRALRELNAGNNLAALSLVERLMQNPRNRNITKLIELQRRIQSVL